MHSRKNERTNERTILEATAKENQGNERVSHGLTILTVIKKIAHKIVWGHGKTEMAQEIKVLVKKLLYQQDKEQELQSCY